MSRLIPIIILLLSGHAAWAHSFKDLFDCGIRGRVIKVNHSTNEMIPNGEYLQVTSMEPLSCSSWDWIFLADPEVYNRMRKILNTGTQLLLSAPGPISVDGHVVELQALTLRARSEAVGHFSPVLNLNHHALLVTPQTNIYGFIHELRHLGDYTSRGDKIFDTLDHLDLDYHASTTILQFVLETSAYAEQFRRLMSANRSMEYVYRNRTALLVAGETSRKKDLSNHRRYFRKAYAEPMRALLDFFHHAQPRKARELRQALADLIWPEDLVITGVRDLFPELPSCEALLR